MIEVLQMKALWKLLEVSDVMTWLQAFLIFLGHSQVYGCDNVIDYEMFM